MGLVSVHSVALFDELGKTRRWRMGGEADVHECTYELRVCLWVRGALTRARGGGTIADIGASGPVQILIQSI